MVFVMDLPKSQTLSTTAGEMCSKVVGQGSVHCSCGRPVLPLRAGHGVFYASASTDTATLALEKFRPLAVLGHGHAMGYTPE